MSFGRNINEKTNFKHPAYPLYGADALPGDGPGGVRKNRFLYGDSRQNRGTAG